MVQRVVVFPTQGTVVEPSAAEQMLASLTPPIEYSINARNSYIPGKKTLAGAFDHIEFSNGKVQAAMSREALSLRSDTKLFRQNLERSDQMNEFIAPDGSELRLDSSITFSPGMIDSGREVRFSQPASIEYAYKARPLNGIWATAASYLHNGSVPNLDELLKPSAKRAKKFYVGSREFDPVNVGFVSDSGSFEFDTTLPGNSNIGHDIGPELSDVERAQLIEYLKSL